MMLNLKDKNIFMDKNDKRIKVDDYEFIREDYTVTKEDIL